MSDQLIKPTYSLSATLINSLKWHKIKNTDKSYQDLVQKLTKSYGDNFFTIKGQTFEEEVITGQHSVFKPYTQNAQFQKWFSKVLDFGSYNIRLSGRFDIVSNDNKHIYDIKRVGYHYKDKYTRKTTVQHDLYLFLNDEAVDFTYLIAADGSIKNSVEYHIETVKKEPNLEEYIRKEITEFLEFLHTNNLLFDYMENYEFMPSYEKPNKVVEVVKEVEDKEDEYAEYMDKLYEL